MSPSLFLGPQPATSGPEARQMFCPYLPAVGKGGRGAARDCGKGEGCLGWSLEGQKRAACGAGIERAEDRFLLIHSSVWEHEKHRDFTRKRHRRRPPVSGPES